MIEYECSGNQLPISGEGLKLKEERHKGHALELELLNHLYKQAA